MNISVTSKAREKIAGIVKDKKMESPVIRITMEGFG
jgi:Fe-S cluster assembly iron-binding protein IscA